MVSERTILDFDWKYSIRQLCELSFLLYIGALTSFMNLFAERDKSSMKMSQIQMDMVNTVAPT